MSSASSKFGTERAVFGWPVAILIALVAIVGFDILLGLLFNLVLGISQIFYGPSNLVIRFLGDDSIGLNFGLYALSRLLALGWLYILVRRRGGWPAFGFRRPPLLKSAGWVVAAGVLFLVVITLLLAGLNQLVPGLNLEQEQDIIFKAAQSHLEVGLAFIALIVIAPLVEEVVFRGVLFASLLKRFGLIAATLVTSVLFGLIHWQLNVSIVTGVLSLFLCGLYYKTGSIWPAIMLHSLKNLVAFIIIF